MRKREPRFNVDPETGELVEIDEELDAAIEEALASSERGEGIPGSASGGVAEGRALQVKVEPTVGILRLTP